MSVATGLGGTVAVFFRFPTPDDAQAAGRTHPDRSPSL
jgi:hypothetical protein